MSKKVLRTLLLPILTTKIKMVVLNKKVEVQYVKKDRTGCVGGVVFLHHEKGTVDVNLTLVLNGVHGSYMIIA